MRGNKRPSLGTPGQAEGQRLGFGLGGGWRGADEAQEGEGGRGSLGRTPPILPRRTLCPSQRGPGKLGVCPVLGTGPSPHSSLPGPVRGGTLCWFLVLAPSPSSLNPTASASFSQPCGSHHGATPPQALPIRESARPLTQQQSRGGHVDPLDLVLERDKSGGACLG